MKQREIFVRVEWSKQCDVCGLYLVQSRLAHGFAGLASARAVPGAADSRTASATAAQAIVLRAARRSAAVLVECIDVTSVFGAQSSTRSASTRHRSLSGAACGHGCS